MMDARELAVPSARSRPHSRHRCGFPCRFRHEKRFRFGDRLGDAARCAGSRPTRSPCRSIAALALASRKTAEPETEPSWSSPASPKPRCRSARSRFPLESLRPPDLRTTARRMRKNHRPRMRSPRRPALRPDPHTGPRRNRRSQSSRLRMRQRNPAPPAPPRIPETRTAAAAA